MKAAVYHGPGDLRISQVAKPGDPGPDEVLLQIEMASVCGTDVSQFQAATMIPLDDPHPVSGQKAPLILGHEAVGIVVQKGTNVTDLAIGQRVVPGCAFWCGTCQNCLGGRGNICQRAFLYGIHADGVLAEFAKFAARTCVPVPESCSLVSATFAQPFAVALHAISRAKIQSGQLIAIFGIGGIGSLILAALHAEQIAGDGAPACSVIAVDINPARLETAGRLGTTIRVNANRCDPVKAIQQITDGEGVDLAIDATGRPETITQALTTLRRGGSIAPDWHSHRACGYPTQPTGC